MSWFRRPVPPPCPPPPPPVSGTVRVVLDGPVTVEAQTADGFDAVRVIGRAIVDRAPVTIDSVTGQRTVVPSSRIVCAVFTPDRPAP